MLHGGEQAERLQPLLLLASTADESALTTLPEYVERMKEEQEAIYYAVGDSRSALEGSPHLEAFRDRGYEVLLLTDPVDELMVGHIHEHDGKKLQSVTTGDIELGTDEEREEGQEAAEEREKAAAPLLETLQRELDDHVKEVRLSGRLKESPACLVGDPDALTPHLRRMMREAGNELPAEKRTLELNPDHEVFRRLFVVFEADRGDGRVASFAQLLFGQALLAEGSPLPDPAGFSSRVTELMLQAAEPEA